MRRAAWVVGVLLGVTGPGWAQTPAVADLREGMTFPLRTAGQPDRRVRVEKVCRVSDRAGLVDVIDLDTGAKYTLPVHAFKSPPPAAPAVPQPAPSAPIPAVAPVAGATPALLPVPVIQAAVATVPATPTGAAAAPRWFARPGAKPEPAAPAELPVTGPPLAVTPPPGPAGDPLNAVPASPPVALPPATFAPGPVGP